MCKLWQNTSVTVIESFEVDVCWWIYDPLLTEADTGWSDAGFCTIYGVWDDANGHHWFINLASAVSLIDIDKVYYGKNLKEIGRRRMQWHE